jgi:hypothetical protein
VSLAISRWRKYTQKIFFRGTFIFRVGGFLCRGGWGAKTQKIAESSCRLVIQRTARSHKLCAGGRGGVVFC